MWEVGAVIIYACFDGQRQSATCGKDLKWHPDPPTCKDTSKQCSPLPSPSKGKLFSSDGFRINASVFFSCDEGYALHGPATLVCRPTGAWDPPMMPTCSAPPPWIIILSVCLAVFASLVLCCLGFFYFMRRRRRRTPPPRNYRRQIRKPGPYDAISNDEVARLGKPFPVTSL
ncbi:hypothetical protein HPB50_020401 [Hyalomma asiaticum]|uniref:Uncharacterized protein n=1 Tax=Hyalomma asiaticum TaxID=266040 RepID=A0ACB7RMD7_HYAAI|nr:hypothetical protein HPB50_020401 [Hyalomma asiaticum]